MSRCDLERMRDTLRIMRICNEDQRPGTLHIKIILEYICQIRMETDISVLDLFWRHLYGGVGPWPNERSSREGHISNSIFLDYERNLRHQLACSITLV